jgi:hypothetical protein
VCLKALLKVGGESYITLRGEGKALEKIDVFHPLLRKKDVTS